MSRKYNIYTLKTYSLSQFNKTIILKQYSRKKYFLTFDITFLFILIKDFNKTNTKLREDL